MTSDTPRCPNCGVEVDRRYGRIKDDAGRLWHHHCVRRVLAAIETAREKQAREEFWFKHIRPKEEV